MLNIEKLAREKYKCDGGNVKEAITYAMNLEINGFKTCDNCPAKEHCSKIEIKNPLGCIEDFLAWANTEVKEPDNRSE